MDDGRTIGWLAYLQPVWRGLRQPWLLLFSGALIVFLLLSTRAIPQLPTLLVNDPAASARWLRLTSQSYGANGQWVQALGLFDVLHSPLLRLLMIWLGLLLAVQMGEQIGVLQQLRALPALLRQPPAQSGLPLVQHSSTPLHQQRYIEPDVPETVAARLVPEMAQHYANPIRVDAPLAALAENENPENKTAAEIRLLGVKNSIFGYLRLLFLGGILMALMVVWWISQRSWEIPALLLAPGDTVRYGALLLGFSYAEATPPTAPDAVTIQVQLGETKRALTIGGAGGSLRIGQVNISGDLGPPGLQVSTVDGNRVLTRPGQAGVADTIGLVFPNEGNEEFILIPQEAVALRILRAANRQAPYFLVQVYNQSALDEGNAQPVQRFEVAQRQELTIPAQGVQLPLTFDPRPSVMLQAQSLPGLWLLWPALAAIVAGLFSLFRQPAFQIVQIAPWPDAAGAGALVIVQSSRKR
ncbi:MAG: hypothetical protein R3A44_10700 [Caldilineaceae bacterium]